MPPLILPADERRPLPLRRNSGFHLLWISTVASGLGNRLVLLAALPLLGVIGVHAQAASITAAIHFWYFLPWVLLGPLAGWLADTLPRKWLLVACEQGRAALLLLALLLLAAVLPAAGADAAVLTPHQRWLAFALVAAVGVCAAVFNPTRNAVIPQVIPHPQLHAVNATILAAGVLAGLAGFGLGGWLYSRDLVRPGVAVALAAFACSGAAFAFLRVPSRHAPGTGADRRDSEWRRLRRALQYLRHHRPVRHLVYLGALVWTMAVILVSALAALSKQRYGLPGDRFVAAYAGLSASAGAGMLAGAGLVAAAHTRREGSLLLLLLLLPAGPLLAALALCPSYFLALPLAFGLGLTGGGALVLAATLTQAVTANFVLGRVSGVREVLANLVQVGVNLLVWQLPWLRAEAVATAGGFFADGWLDSALPESDWLLIAALYPLSAVFLSVAGWGLWDHATRGPYPSRAANFLIRLDRLYVLALHRLEWVGRDRIPAAGPVIIAANHTTALDPFLIQAAVPRLIGWIMLTAFQFRILGFLWRAIQPIALDEGARNHTKLRRILARLRAGEVVGIFPEGGLQRERRELQPFAPGIGMLARRTGAPILPVWIEGTPRARHMLWHFLAPSRSRVIFGHPYHPDPALSPQQIADDLRQRLLALAGTARSQSRSQESGIRSPSDSTLTPDP